MPKFDYSAGKSFFIESLRKNMYLRIFLFGRIEWMMLFLVTMLYGIYLELKDRQIYALSVFAENIIIFSWFLCVLAAVFIVSIKRLSSYNRFQIHFITGLVAMVTASAIIGWNIHFFENSSEFREIRNLPESTPRERSDKALKLQETYFLALLVSSIGIVAAVIFTEWAASRKTAGSLPPPKTNDSLSG